MEPIPPIPSININFDIKNWVRDILHSNERNNIRKRIHAYERMIDAMQVLLEMYKDAGAKDCVKSFGKDIAVQEKRLKEERKQLEILLRKK